MARTFHIVTFGCRTNQADSGALREAFLSRGYREQVEPRADVVVVNSCTVTQRSDQQVRQMVRRLRRSNPEAKLIVTGCYAQRDPRALSSIEGVDAVVGNTHKSEVVSIAAKRLIDPLSFSEVTRVFRDSFDSSLRTDRGSVAKEGQRTRPFVKVQDGCDAHCTYCVIPEVRGPSRSVPPDQLIEQVRDLVREGFQEIVLTGIHIGTYGRYMDPPLTFHKLLKKLLEIERLQRLRISSIEPMELSRQVIHLAAASEGRIAPHFHICLQSGCDRILKRMLRPYKTARFRSLIEEIRTVLPEAGIGTDVIGGFPGESDQDHQESLEFVKQMPLTYIHVFPYSDRPGTAASTMGRKVDGATVRDRCAQFREISERKNLEFRTRQLGRKVAALTLSDFWRGQRVALTDNYLKALVDPRIPGNRLVRLRARVGPEGHLSLS